MHYENYILTILKCGIPFGVQKSQEYTYIKTVTHNALFINLFTVTCFGSQLIKCLMRDS